MYSAVVSVRCLAQLLNTPLDWLNEIDRHRDSLYRPYVSYKRGKAREIDRPVDPLKRVQRSLYELFLRDYPLPPYVLGGVRGKNIFNAVEPHVHRNLVVAVDIRDFYPSVRHKAVFKMWRELLGNGDDVSSMLTRLTTFRGHLPQGAPTSMAIANAVLLPADLEIARGIENLGDVTYTRWVDDLLFSGDADPADILEIVTSALTPLDLEIHRKRDKRRIMRGAVSQSALGLTINRRAAIPRAKRAQLRAAVHELASGRGGNVPSIMGRLQFLKNCHPRKASRLLKSLFEVSERARARSASV